MSLINRLGLLLLFLAFVWGSLYRPETYLEKALLASGALVGIGFLSYRRQAPEAHTCGICGTALERYQKRCGYCGADNSSSLCPRCGRSIWDHGLRSKTGNPCKYLED